MLSKIWARIEESRKLQICFFSISMIILVVIYSLASIEIKNIVVSEKEPVLDYKILCNIEKIETDNEVVKFKGWALRMASQNVSTKLVLQSLDGTDIEVIDTKSEERRDIEEYYVPNWDFGQCGFVTEIKQKKLVDDLSYEIFLMLEYKEKQEDDKETIEMTNKVSTGQFYCNGRLYNYNPQEFFEPSITDTELSHIIDEGVVKAFDPNEQIWVYQYGNTLYFIVNSRYDSLKESSIRIPVMPHTSRTELLPENRQQYGVDHLGAYCEDDKYRREGVLPYQVTEVELLVDYPVTYISTGLYDDEVSEWICHFVIPMAEWREGYSNNK